MRLYDVAVAALAIDAPIKWTDNVLSQHRIPGVIGARRGVARRLPHSALLHLAVVRELQLTLGMSVREAVRLATDLIGEGGENVHRSGHLRVSLDRPAMERALAARLRDALESAPTPRRGRPTRRASRA
jgi:hypothetical protein